MKKNLYNTVLLNFFYFSLILVLTYIYYAYKIGYDAIKFVYFTWYMCVTFISIKKNGFFSVYSLFLLFSAFFIYDSLFFDLINYGKYSEFTVNYFARKYEFKYETGVLFLLYSSVFLFILDICYYLFIVKKNSFISNTTINFSISQKKQIGKIAFILMLLVYPFMLYKFYCISLYMMKHGYIAVIMGQIDEITYPLWLNGFAGFFLVFFYVVVMCNPSKRIVFISCVLFCINAFVKGLGGSRGAFLYDFFMIIVLYLSLYGSKKVKTRTVVFIGIFCLCFAFVIGETRDRSSKNKEIVIQENFILNFLASQTNTRAVPLVVIENKIPYHNYPFIFSRIIDGDGGNEVLRGNKIKKYNNMDLLTLYTISPRAVYNGNGLGGAIIAEFIDCYGFLGVIFWTYFLSTMIVFLENVKKNNIFTIPFVCILMQNMFHNPRGYFFAFLGGLKYCFVAIFIYLLIDLFVKFFFRRGKGV